MRQSPSGPVRETEGPGPCARGAGARAGRRAAGGWTVTDDGSTLSGLRTRGAATDAPAFLEAWGRLARPTGDFVPGRDSDDGEITGWATDETLGDVLNIVALASVRAEGLALIRERGSAERFPNGSAGASPPS